MLKGIDPDTLTPGPDDCAPGTGGACGIDASFLVTLKVIRRRAIMPQIDTITVNATIPHSMSEAPEDPSFSPPSLLNMYLIKPQKNTTIASVMNRIIIWFNRVPTVAKVPNRFWALAKAGRDRTAAARAERLAIFARINIDLISLMYK
ncbi:MAG: hypothetical protein Q7S05_05040 [bacterium]|nr:hypothetical protein [bacterium]